MSLLMLLLALCHLAYTSVARLGPYLRAYQSRCIQAPAVSVYFRQGLALIT